MKRSAILLLAALALTGCGGGPGAPDTVTAAAPAVDPNTVASVAVNADYRKGDSSGEYLADVTLRTAGGSEYHIEYCSDPVKVGDMITLVPYEGDLLLCVNGVQEAVIIDWDALEKHVKEGEV